MTVELFKLNSPEFFIPTRKVTEELLLSLLRGITPEIVQADKPILLSGESDRLKRELVPYVDKGGDVRARIKVTKVIGDRSIVTSNSQGVTRHFGNEVTIELGQENPIYFDGVNIGSGETAGLLVSAVVWYKQSIG